MPTTCQQTSPQPEPLALHAPGEGESSRAAKPCPDGGCGRRYKRGLPAKQPMLLPPSVDDYVGADNPVRAIAAYVDTLDLAALGFAYATGSLGAGQPAYDPADLLKLYLYGYLNRVRSSRRLAAECVRNLEVIWLLNGLTPSYHTIADVRKNNAKALKATNREFVALCQDLGLIGGKTLGIDGSFFNASASDRSVKTKQQLEAELAAMERDIERYHQDLDGNDAADAAAPGVARISAEQLDDIKARAERRREQLKTLAETGETQVSRTDPDARRLRKNGKALTGYNVQTVVDDRHHLILTHKVTNAGNDLGQLAPMIAQAKAVLGQTHADAPVLADAPTLAAPAHAAATASAATTDAAMTAGEEPATSSPTVSSATTAAEGPPLTVLADAGYFTEADIAACQAQGISVSVPIPEKKGSADSEGRLPGSAFRYDAERDCYHCPGGQVLTPMGKPSPKDGVLRQRYASSATQCAGCPLRATCLPQTTPFRQLYRSEHAAAVARHREHMAGSQAQMRKRAALCEHPFGTMKRWLGWDHFLVRGFEKVRGEMALLVHCYNFRRLLSILSVQGFIDGCRQRCRERQAGNQGGGLFARPCLPLWRSLRPCPAFWRALRFLRTPGLMPAAAPTALASAG